MCRERIAELEEIVKASSEVNRHLATEVERLSLENDSYHGRVHYLTKLLKQRHKRRPNEEDKGDKEDKEDKEEEADEDAKDDGVLSHDVIQHVVEGEEAYEVWTKLDWNQLAAQGRLLGWLIDPEHVDLGEVAGQGSFGTTRKGVWRGVDCCVKMVTPSSTEQSIEAFARELVAMSIIRHPNVVSFYGAVIDPPDRCWIVCEWIPNGTLSHWLHGVPGAPRRPQRTLLERLQVALDVACGMEVLEQHDPPIIHRDLKPSNVMMDSDFRAKVSDMGLSRILTHSALLSLTPETGSYLYMAPEVMRHELYATQADVWSWGCLVCELLSGMKPYEDRYLTPVQVALAVAENSLRPNIPITSCPPRLMEILSSALSPNPLERPSFAIIVSVMKDVLREEIRRANVNAQQSRRRWWG